MKLCFPGTSYVPYGHKKNDVLSAAVLIDGHALIQPSDDLFRFAERYGLYELTEAVRECIVPCSHPRAFSKDVLKRLAQSRPLTLLSSDAVAHACRELARISRLPLYSFRTVTVGGLFLTPLPTGYTTAVPAEDCFCFHVSDGRRAVYVGLPNGYPSDAVLQFLCAHPVDAAVYDVSYGTQTVADEKQHLTFVGACRLREQMTAGGALCGRAYTLLVSLPPFASPDEKNSFSEQARKEGFLLPYDGYFIEL